MHIIDLLDSIPDIVRLEYSDFSSFYESVVDVSREGALYRVLPDIEAVSEYELRSLLSILVPKRVRPEMSFSEMKRLFVAIDACFYVNLISK